MLIFLCATGDITAQTRDTIHAANTNKRNQPLKNLDLSPAQKKELKLINQQSKKSADSVKNDTTLTTEMRRDIQKKLLTMRRQHIMQVLTPEQQIKYNESMKANVQARRKKKIS